MTFKKHNRGLVACMALGMLLAITASNAFATAVITIVNNNAAGVGFNDPAPRAPVGGNPGVTLGAQRLFIFQYGANIWGNILTSSVPILVRSQFAAQTCTATSAVLGSTGALTIHRDFAGAPFTGTWYQQSLANKLFGSDLSAANPDMTSTFNSNIDLGCFGPGLLWYYGTDGLEGTNIELLPVIMHELGHGLGFASTTNGSTGVLNGGFPGAYDHFLMDNVSGLHWDVMTNAQRAANAISINHLVWDGARGKAEAAAFLGPRPQLKINSPGVIAGSYDVQTATFGAALTLGGFTGNIVQVDDGVAPNEDACEPIINGAAVFSNIALIDRGTCTFVLKALAAQAAGATGMIVVNNVPTGLPGMGGTDPSITIPCIGISQADGNAIKAQLGGGVNCTMLLDPAKKAGADNTGHPFMYAPSPFASGSSVSHWDISASPNALMEPAINNDLHDTVDITHGLFVDIGWFPETVPVTLDEFAALGQADGVLVRWHFSDLTDVGSITLERAVDVNGPFAPQQTELGQEGAVTTALDTSAEPGVTYYYHLRITDRRGQGSVVGTTYGQRLSESMRVSLMSPNPNPVVNGVTALRYRIGQAGHVKLTITDVSGRQVRLLQDEAVRAGEHLMQWDGKNSQGSAVAAGVYFVRLQSTMGAKTQRVTVVR